MSNEMPVVTVVTPSFNQGRWIRETIDSVLSQDYPHIEYVVMDGGSTDDTLEILRSYGDRVRWVSGPDGGQSQALQTGFAKGRGSILAWLNSDDVYTPGAVARAVRAFEAHPEVGLVYGNADYIDGESRPLGPVEHVVPIDGGNQLLTLGNCVVQPAAFFRRSAYEAIGGIKPELFYTMDYDLWLRLAKAGPTLFVQDRLALVRCTPVTKTSTGGWKRLSEIETTIGRNGGSRLPPWFELELVAMHARKAVDLARARQSLPAAMAALSALRHLAAPRTLATLGEKRTWRMIRQSRKNAG